MTQDENLTEILDSIKKYSDTTPTQDGFNRIIVHEQFVGYENACENVDFDNLKFSLKQLYTHNATNNIYWQWCDLKTYKNNFHQFKKEFFKENIDAEESDFIEIEISKLKLSYDRDLLSLSHPIFTDEQIYDFDLQLFIETDIHNSLRPIIFSHQKKLKFLQDKLTSLNTSIETEQHLNKVKSPFKTDEAENMLTFLITSMLTP